MLPYTLQYPSAACQVLGGSQTHPTVVRARRGAGSERPQVYETFQALQASCGLYATLLGGVARSADPSRGRSGVANYAETRAFEAYRHLVRRATEQIRAIDRLGLEDPPRYTSCAAARPGGACQSLWCRRASAPRMTKLVATRAWIERAACRHVTHGCMAVRGLDPCEFKLLRSARSAAVTASTGCSLAEGHPAGRAAYTVTLRLPRHGG